VFDGFARQKGVEYVVGEWLSGEGLQDAGGGAAVEPGVDGGGPVRRRECVVQGLQFGSDGAGVVAEDLA
jgi:hypothetical protein